MTTPTTPTPGATGEVTGTYLVTYTRPGEHFEIQAVCKVVLIDGYTTFADIPKIIATTTGARVEDIIIVAATLISE